MTIPTLLLGFLLATLYGALFHLWRDGGAGRLLLYLFLSWLGFWIGDLMAGFVPWAVWPIGALDAGAATLGSALFLSVGHWLSLVRAAEEG